MKNEETKCRFQNYRECFVFRSACAGSSMNRLTTSSCFCQCCFSHPQPFPVQPAPSHCMACHVQPVSSKYTAWFSCLIRPDAGSSRPGYANHALYKQRKKRDKKEGENHESAALCMKMNWPLLLGMSGRDEEREKERERALSSLFCLLRVLLRVLGSIVQKKKVEVSKRPRKKEVEGNLLFTKELFTHIFWNVT